jgi:ubiquinone biosynthesis protein COQ4
MLGYHPKWAALEATMLVELRNLGLTSPWQVWLAVQNFAKTVWDPTRSDIQHGINALVYEALRNAPPDREAEVARENPELAALFREGYDPALEPARLAALPDGTLGREYARFIRANQIDPLGNLLALSRPKNLLEYQFWRSYKLHDVLHVVLGCDATALGEVPIVAYSLGQARSTGVRAPAMALAVLLLHMALRKPAQVQPAVGLAAEWMRRGEQTRGYASHRLEDWMDRPVAEVRALVLAPA